MAIAQEQHQGSSFGPGSNGRNLEIVLPDGRPSIIGFEVHCRMRKVEIARRPEPHHGTLDVLGNDGEFGNAVSDITKIDEGDGAGRGIIARQQAPAELIVPTECASIQDILAAKVRKDTS